MLSASLNKTFPSFLLSLFLISPLMHTEMSCIQYSVYSNSYLVLGGSNSFYECYLECTSICNCTGMSNISLVILYAWNVTKQEFTKTWNGKQSSADHCTVSSWLHLAKIQQQNVILLTYLTVVETTLIRVLGSTTGCNDLVFHLDILYRVKSFRNLVFVVILKSSSQKYMM